MKTCPDCAEEVRAAAAKCRYCGYRFDTALNADESGVTDAAQKDPQPDTQPRPSAEDVHRSARSGSDTPRSQPSHDAGSLWHRHRRWLVAAAALVLLLLAGGAAVALTKTSSGSSAAKSWPQKDVRDFHKTCATTGTSNLTCQQELTCLQAHVHPSTYEHIYAAETRHTVDARRMDKCIGSVPYRAHFSQQ